MTSWIRRRPLAAFFMLTFGINWTMAAVRWFPLGNSVAALAFHLEGFSPTLAAVAVTIWLDGGAGLRRLVQRCTRWRVAWRGYVIVLLGFPAFLAASIGAGIVIAGQAAVTTESVNAMTWASLPLLAFMGGPLHEELGWRGFALPRLLDRFGDLTASVVLGVLWAVWHWQPWDMSTFLARDAFGVLVANQIAAVALAIVMTWVYRNTGDSALLAGFGMHLSANTVLGMVTTGFTVTVPAAVAWGQAGGLTLLAVVIVARCGPRRFSATRRPAPETGRRRDTTTVETGGRVESRPSLNMSPSAHAAMLR